MKIAVLVDKFPAPSETFILSQITGLIDRGHEVDIYANTKEDEFSTIDNTGRYDFEGRTWHFQHGAHRIPANKLLRIAKACNLLHECWKRDRLNLVKSLNVIRFGKKAVSLELLYKTIAFAGKNSYDIVHCHFGPNGQVGVALKDIGVVKGKVITTYYGNDISHYIRKNGPNAYDFLFTHGDLFIAISEKMRKDLLRLGCSRNKNIVLRLGVDLLRFKCSPRKKMPENKIQLLTIGRFVEKKGIGYAIHTVAQTVKKYPTIEYKIVGDGELRKEITQLIARLNVEKHVQLLGWKAPQEVAKLMQDADIFLAPSVTGANGDQEGTPTVLIEAQACELPILSTIHSGIPELVQDGISGFLVPERDTTAMAKKLEYLIAHPEIRKGMGKAGRRWVEKYYDIHKLNDQLISIFENLANGVPKQSE